MNHYLKFPNQAAADSILLDGETPRHRNIDTIGTIYKATGVMMKDKDGIEYPEMAPLDGWHVNVWVLPEEDAAPLQPYVIEPSNAVRCWGNEQATAPVIPHSITRAQARAALILAGLIDRVQPAIDAIADQLQRALVQSDWDNRLTFERDNATLLALATALGLTDAQLDDLFVQGAKL